MSGVAIASFGVSSTLYQDADRHMRRLFGQPRKSRVYGNRWLEQPFRTSPMTTTAGSQALRNKVTTYAPTEVPVTTKTSW